MGLDGLDRDEQLGGALLVGVSAGDEAHDLALAHREPIELGVGHGDLARPGSEGVQDETRQARGEGGIAGSHAPHGLGQVLGRDGLGDVTAGAGPDDADDVVGVIRAGARGYVTKAISTEDLAQAVRRVAAGDAAFSPRLAGFVLDAFGAGTGEVAVADTELDRLSVREREVMRLIARGYTYKECASELFISVKTVETHVSAVLRKLQLSNRNELTRWAVARRIV